MPNALVVHRPRIVIRVLGDEPCSTIKLIFRHSELLQRSWGADADFQLKQTLSGIVCVESFRNNAHGTRCGLTIKYNSMRKNDRVHVCMWKAKRAAQHMTDVVMNGHSH